MIRFTKGTEEVVGGVAKFAAVVIAAIAAFMFIVGISVASFAHWLRA